MNLKRVEVDFDVAKRYISPEVNPTETALLEETKENEFER